MQEPTVAELAQVPAPGRRARRPLTIVDQGRALGTPLSVPANLRTFFRSYYDASGRAFPWREARVSDYRFLVAEVLLRQTRADSVVPIWRRLTRLYRGFAALANAPMRNLVRELRPLGFHRQRALALKELARELRGRVISPSVSIGELVASPHIGYYAAAAFLCFRRGKRLPIVDSNVLRVLGRLFGLRLGRDLRRSPQAWAVAWQVLPRNRPAAHNYGLLDFAAAICRPRAPLCWDCPIRPSCRFGLGRSAGAPQARVE